MYGKRPASSSSYIQLNKKVTNKEVIKEVELEAEKSLLTTKQVCYKFLFEAVMRAKEKRLKFERMMNEDPRVHANG